MDRTDGLLIGGVALLTGAFHRLEDNAVDTTRRNIGLSVRRHVGHGRRLAQDAGALLQLVIAVVMLVQGLRAALREGSAPRDEGVVTEQRPLPRTSNAECDVRSDGGDGRG